MKDQGQTLLPSHLENLLRPTPSGTAKLIAAWDGLTLETQIEALATITLQAQVAAWTAKKVRRTPPYFHQRLLDKALASENAFVRYSAARAIQNLGPGEAEKHLRAQAESDSDPLVRYAHLEGQWSAGKFADPEKFFALPHEARLAIMRGLGGFGKSVAALISYAVEHRLKDGQASETELFELLLDYLASPKFKERSLEYDFGDDGFREYLAERDIEALWGLVPKVPEPLSHVIIEHLPASAIWGRKAQPCENVR